MYRFFGKSRNTPPSVSQWAPVEFNPKPDDELYKLEEILSNDKDVLFIKNNSDIIGRISAYVNVRNDGRRARREIARLLDEYQIRVAEEPKK